MIIRSHAKLTINILVLVNKKNLEIMKKLEQYWKKYLNVNVIYDEPSSIEKYTGQKIHALFLEAESYKIFKLDYYALWQGLNPRFMYVAIAEKRSLSDIDIYKALADQIIYTKEQETMLEWNSFAILRRYWNVSSNESTIIYKDIIADFDEHKIYLNQELIGFTRKEYEVFKILIQHRGSYVHKSLVLKKVWDQDQDGSRTLDQVIQRIKAKVGEGRFTIKRSIGVRFE